MIHFLIEKLVIIGLGVYFTSLFGWQYAALGIITYLSIGATIVRNHIGRPQLQRPPYTKSLSGRVLSTLAWPLTQHMRGLGWFVPMCVLSYLVHLFILLQLQDRGCSSPVSLIVVLIFNVLPFFYLVNSALFAIFRIFTALFQFKFFCVRALFRAFFRWPSTKSFILDKDPLLPEEILRPNLMYLMPGAPRKKMALLIAAWIFLFADCVTWLSAYLQTMAGKTNGFPGNDENKASMFAHSLTMLAKE